MWVSASILASLPPVPLTSSSHQDIENSIVSASVCAHWPVCSKGVPCLDVLYFRWTWERELICDFETVFGRFLDENQLVFFRQVKENTANLFLIEINLKKGCSVSLLEVWRKGHFTPACEILMTVAGRSPQAPPPSLWAKARPRGMKDPLSSLFFLLAFVHTLGYTSV